MDNDKTVAHRLPTGRGLPTSSTGRRYRLEESLANQQPFRLKPLLELTADAPDVGKLALQAVPGGPLGTNAKHRFNTRLNRFCYKSGYPLKNCTTGKAPLT